jgi:predicted transcriptional regulator
MDGMKGVRLSDEIARQIVNMQREWCRQESKLLELALNAPPRKITRMERAKWWINARRVDLAKWIAGDDWPDEY